MTGLSVLLDNVSARVNASYIDLDIIFSPLPSFVGFSSRVSETRTYRGSSGIGKKGRRGKIMRALVHKFCTIFLA